MHFYYRPLLTNCQPGSGERKPARLLPKRADETHLSVLKTPICFQKGDHLILKVKPFMTKSEGDERMGAISFYVSLVSIFILFPYYETSIITSEPGSYPVLVLGNFNKN